MSLKVLDYKALLIETASPDAVLSSTANAEVISRGDTSSVFVPWTFDNARALAAIHAPSLSTIVRDYKFPGRFSPYAYQQKICNFLALYRRNYCFADMGLGKTACGVWSADYLVQMGAASKILVVCPLSIMEPAWGNELFNIIPGEPYTLLHGSAAERKKLVRSTRRWHIINFDGIEILAKELKANQYDLIIIDESTAYKTHTTRRWKALNSIIKPETQVWAFTGTPTPNNPLEAYGQARLVTPWTLNQMSFSAFRDKTMSRVREHVWMPLPRATEEVNKVLQPAIRLRKVDCLKDLPPVTHTYIKSELSKEQQRIISDLRKKAVATDSGFTVTAVHAASLLTKVFQVATGAVYDDNGTALSVDMKPRIETARDLIRRARQIQTTNGTVGGKTLLFAPYRHTVEVLKNELSDEFNVAVIHGDVPTSRRATILSEFQNTDNLDVIIAVPSTMSHGVTATAANTIIWFGPGSFGAETYQQACNRMDRPGQTQPMLIAHIYSIQTERTRYDILKDREAKQEEVLSMYHDFLRGA